MPYSLYVQDFKALPHDKQQDVMRHADEMTNNLKIMVETKRFDAAKLAPTTHPSAVQMAKELKTVLDKFGVQEFSIHFDDDFEIYYNAVNVHSATPLIKVIEEVALYIYGLIDFVITDAKYSD